MAYRDVAVESFQVRFGRHIRQLRQQRGMSQTMLAQRIHLNLATLSNIERGRYAIGFNKLESLAHALDVSLSDLFRVDASIDRKT